MMKLTVLAILSALVASASAFVSPKVSSKGTALASSTGVWDPLGLYELGSGSAFDTFPGVFPDKQYLQASEVKHGRQAMLAWTGVWATTDVSSCFHSFLRFINDDVSYNIALLNILHCIKYNSGWFRIRSPLSRIPR